MTLGDLIKKAQEVKEASGKDPLEFVLVGDDGRLITIAYFSEHMEEIELSTD